MRIKQIEQEIKDTRYKTHYFIKWYNRTMYLGINDLIDWDNYYKI